MLLEETTNINWNEIKKAVTYLETESLAVLRPDRNVLQYLPVYLNDATNDPFVRIEDQWVPVNELRTFERYQKLGHKRLFDTATLEVLE